MIGKLAVTLDLVASCLALAALTGCGDSAPPPVAPGSTVASSEPTASTPAAGEVSGRVVDDAGEPIASATIRGYPIRKESLDETWRQDHTRETTADLSGSFELTGLLEGRVYLSTSAAGFCGTASTRRECLTDDRDVEIVLTRCASVVGRVFGPDGRPLADAHVEMRAFAPAPGSQVARGGTDRDSVTGSGGYYSLPSLPLGEVELIATHPRHREQSLFIELHAGDAITGLDFHL